ncbi:MAG: ABC transporter substrate-binding protein [Candidatus Dormibacter sp.]|uniref:ABC transporter substrate-binding protein n=1 Tax=Candidatus Dormibacter sp. TaxID=2973982 RepID=UPI0026AF9E94
MTRRASQLLALVLFVAACSQGETPAPAAAVDRYHAQPAYQKGGTALLADYEYPATLNPMTARTDVELRLAQLSFARLWGLDDQLRPYPDLARRVPTEQNGGVQLGGSGAMTVTIELVPGLRWSDGQPIGADDVLLGWQALQKQAGRQLPDGAALSKQSDSKLTWSFSEVYAPYLALGAELFPLPAHRLPGTSGDAFFARPDVTSGPFAPAAAVPGQRLDWLRNPHYADGRSERGAYPAGDGPFTHQAWLDGVSFRTVPSRQALLDQAQAGGADLISHLTAPDLAALRLVPGQAIAASAAERMEFLRPLGTLRDDRQLLDALSLALDREQLVHDSQAGYGKPASGPFPSALTAAGAIGGSRPDPAAARRALAGRTVTVTVLALCEDASGGLTQGSLARQWAPMGVTVRATCRPRDQFLAALQGTEPLLALYSDDPGSDPSDWAPLACPDRALQESLTVGRTSLDPAARRRAFQAAAQRWVGIRCTLPLYEPERLSQVSARLHNFAPSPGSGLGTWNAADWWLQAG